MADISAEITAFKNAVYGEDVRDAMVSLANKLNGSVSDAVDIVNRCDDDVEGLRNNIASINNRNGFAKVTNINVITTTQVTVPLIYFNLDPDIYYSIYIKIASPISKTVYLNIKDSNNNLIFGNLGVLYGNQINNTRFKVNQKYDNAHAEISVATDVIIEECSIVKEIDYESYNIKESINQNISNILAHNVLYANTYILNTLQPNVWVENTIISPLSVTKNFKLRLNNCSGDIDLSNFKLEVRVIYAGITGAQPLGTITHVGETITCQPNFSRTIEKYYIVFYPYSERQSYVKTTKWDLCIWEIDDESYSIPALTNSVLMLLNQDVATLPGIFYGPVSKYYTAETTNENWQEKSVAFMRDIPVSGYKYAYLIIGSRHGLGLRSISVALYTNISDTEPSTNLGYEPNKYDYGPCIRLAHIPNNISKITVRFEGISNATTAGTPSVIGETYFVKDCTVYLTNELILKNEKVLDSDWSTAISTMRTQQGSSLCFGIQSDTHFGSEGVSTSSEYIGRQLSEASKYIGFDFIANLGDITRGYYNGTAAYPDSSENMHKYATEIMHRYTTGCSCPFLVAIGNHEPNTSWPIYDPQGSIFTRKQLHGQYIKQVINTSSRIKCHPEKNYYYLELESARVIVVHTNDSDQGSFAISDEQATWFTNEALNTQKPVLILAHVPLVSGWSGDSNYSSDYTKIINPLEAFKTNGGTVIACLYGHMHRQDSQKINDIWHIVCTRSESTVYKNAEFFMVDLNTYDITTIGIGQAQSRSFAH